MEQRVALVTGAGAGIGAAIAKRLGQAELRMIVTDRDISTARQTAQELTDVGIEAQALQLDVGDLNSINDAFGAVTRQYGRCDILVNNAGVAKTYDFFATPDDVWLQTLTVNVTGAFRCSQRAAQLMVPLGWGRIINVSSISSMRAGFGRTAYGVSKAALNALTRQLCIELAPHGITANTVAPGPVETQLAHDLHTDTTREELCRMIPGGKYGTPASIAGAVAFLCSDEADYINGHTLPVDGGLMAAGVLRI